MEAGEVILLLPGGELPMAQILMSNAKVKECQMMELELGSL